MPYEISSLAYLTYALIGTGGIWLATRVVREKVVTSTTNRSMLAMAPLFVPLIILIWVRPDLSGVSLRTEGIAGMLARHLSFLLSPLEALNPWMLLGFIRLEMRIFVLVAQFSGMLLVAGIGAATALLLFSQFLGQWFVCRTQGTVPIERGEIPELDRIVLKLARKAGIPPPRILLIEDLRPQAFTIGSGSSASLVFSTGLLVAAGPEELEAIAAHEVAHLKGRDSQLKLLVNWLRLLSFYNPFAHMAAGDAAREREFAADHGAIEWLTERESLIRGLQLASVGKIGHGKGIAYFSSLISAFSFASHHPPPEERIRAASGSRQIGGDRRHAWAATAVFLVLGSILVPATFARRLQPWNPVLPPAGWRSHLPDIRKHLVFTPIPEELLGEPARTTPEPLEMRLRVPSSHQNRIPGISIAEPPSGAGPRLNRPVGLFKADHLDTRLEPNGLLRAAALATMLLRNIYQI